MDHGWMDGSRRRSGAFLRLLPLRRSHGLPDAEGVDGLDLLGQGGVHEAVSGERRLPLELRRYHEGHGELGPAAVTLIDDFAVNCADSRHYFIPYVGLAVTAHCRVAMTHCSQMCV